MTRENTSDKSGGTWFELLEMIGFAAFSIIILLSLVYWMKDIMAMMGSIPQIYYLVFYTAWVGLSIVAVVWYDKPIRTIGQMSLVIFIAATGLTAAFSLPVYLAPIIVPSLPQWPPEVWLGVGITTSALLFGIGYFAQSVGEKE